MIWYPYEQLKTMKAPYEIVDANGVYLYTKDQKMIDSVSSWWSVIHGYKHPVINQAIISQVEKFSHVMLGGLTHEPARKLSEKLASWLPGDLDYCFFSDPLSDVPCTIFPLMYSHSDMTHSLVQPSFHCTISYVSFQR